MKKTGAEILREAAGYVEEGWLRGSMQGPFGRVCALGAIQKADGRVWDEPPRAAALEACNGLAEVFKGQYSDSYPEWDWEDVGTGIDIMATTMTITMVNDELVKNRKDVIAAMEKAAARLEEKA